MSAAKGFRGATSTRADLAETLAAADTVPIDDLERLEIQLHHVHLPHLGSEQYLQYNLEPGTSFGGEILDRSPTRSIGRRGRQHRNQNARLSTFRRTRTRFSDRWN